MALTIRKGNPAALIIAGGATLTALVEDPAFRVFDALVAGDGEEPLRMIAETVYHSSRDLSGIPNFYYQDGNTFVPPESESVLS